MRNTDKNSDSNELYIGIDIGSVSLNCVVINHKSEILYEFPYNRHLGKVEDEASKLIQELYRKWGREKIRAIGFTGNHGQKISDRLGGFYEFETISQVLGALFLHRDAKTIISMGGQDTALFQISHEVDGWELEYFNTNGPCASGTGSFIDQQAQRLATALYDSDADISQDQVDRILTDVNTDIEFI
ncbi:BadF/BadG/BcrA/BcrD ATPase family protein [Thermodesulfobacteriota bacterium]